MNEEDEVEAGDTMVYDLDHTGLSPKMSRPCPRCHLFHQAMEAVEHMETVILCDNHCFSGAFMHDESLFLGDLW
ncbi:MAG: hypothetical protein IKN31_00770 [Bacteroidales bacterium]|nr:hypothetical protein [Bacteroidales bacterium]